MINPFSIKENVSRIGLEQLRDAVEDGCFPRAIGANKPYDRSCGDRKGDVVNSLEASERLA